MNPFIESTVAVASVPSGLTGAANSAQKKSIRLRFVRLLGALCLITSLGLALSLAFPGNALAVNVNAATQAQLQTVRGIGPKTAQSIIDERLRGGSYESFEDLSDRVKGIGPKKAQSLQSSGLTVGAGTGAQ